MDYLGDQWLQSTGIFLFGGFLSVYTFRNSLWRSRIKLRFLSNSKSIYQISTSNEWEKISSKFCRDAKKIGAIGFDCEWVQANGKRRSVALVQLATFNGDCALVRLCQIKRELSPSLTNLLRDEAILKVGVGTDMDKEYLWTDYGIEVNGILDLRYLAVLSDQVDSNQTENMAMGLSALSERYLGSALDKNWRVRAGDWEAAILTKRQIDYASEDAFAGIKLLLKIISILMEKELTLFELFSWSADIPLRNNIKKICDCYKDMKFSQSAADLTDVVESSNLHQHFKKKSAHLTSP